MSGINLSEEQSFPPTTTVMLSNSESILPSFSVISRMQAPRRQTTVVLGSLFLSMSLMMLLPMSKSFLGVLGLGGSAGRTFVLICLVVVWLAGAVFLSVFI